MQRAKLNFLVDATAFVAFVCLLSTGILMRYPLPPGSGGLALGFVGLVAVVLLAAVPLISSDESMTRRQLQQERQQTEQTEASTDQGSPP